MTNSKPTIIDDLPLVKDNPYNYNLSTVIGKDAGSFATVGGTQFRSDFSVYSDGMYTNAYNKLLIAESVSAVYVIKPLEYSIVVKTQGSFTDYYSPQCTLDNIGDIYSIRYLNSEKDTNLIFVRAKLIDGNTEYATITLTNNLNLKFMMVGLDSNGNVIFVRLRKAI